MVETEAKRLLNLKRFIKNCFIRAPIKVRTNEITMYKITVCILNKKKPIKTIAAMKPTALKIPEAIVFEVIIGYFLEIYTNVNSLKYNNLKSIL